MSLPAMSTLRDAVEKPAEGRQITAGLIYLSLLALGLLAE
jgi:hypothetical protein